MTGRYGVLNILLFFIVLILGYENYRAWSTPDLPAPRKVAGKEMEGKIEPLSGTTAPGEAASREAVNVIAEKNIFNPERKEFSSQAAADMAKPVTRPPITLYGVVITGKYERATIVSPGRPLYKGEREAKTIKVGEMVGAYKLTKILPDRIILEAGEDSFEVLLYDFRTPKKRTAVTTPPSPAKVTSMVPGPTQPAGVPTVPPPTVTPVPGPGTTAQPPGGTYQPPSQPPASTPSPTVPARGSRRGKRPVSPGGSSQ